MFAQHLSIIPPQTSLSTFAYTPPVGVDGNIWSLSSFPDCGDLQNVVWEGDRGGNQGVTLSASFSYPPADLEELAGCFENVVNVFGGVTCTESDYRWEPDFRSYLDDEGILTMSKVSVSQTICRCVRALK